MGRCFEDRAQISRLLRVPNSEDSCDLSVQVGSTMGSCRRSQARAGEDRPRAVGKLPEFALEYHGPPNND